MLRQLEKIINIYYKNNAVFLTVALLLLLGIIVLRLRKITKEPQLNKTFAEALALRIIYLLAVAGIGYVLYCMGISIPMVYDYFHVLFFVGAILLVMLWVLFRMKFRNNKKSASLLAEKYISYVLFWEVFLLSNSAHLELLELLAAITLSTVLTLVTINLSAVSNTQRGNKAERSNETQEIEESENNGLRQELFPSRQRQLERFIVTLKEQSDEPYGIMISSEWGTGKTRFVKALEKELPNDHFIWIDTGSEMTVSEIMNDISDQIIEILEQNDIYVEHTRTIDQYFMAFGGMLEAAGFGIVDKVLSFAHIHRIAKEPKEYLNEKLKQLPGNIYIVVDDLDRCTEEYRQKAFRVIRESLNIKKCKVLFLVDKDKFMVDGLDHNYLEKYSTYNLILCPVTYEEICVYYMEQEINEEFCDRLQEGMSKEILKGKSLEEIHCILMEQSKKNLEIFWAREKAQQEDGKQNDSKQKNAVVIQDAIRRNTENPRKVIRFLQGVRISLNNLKMSWGDYYNELLEADWLLPIVRVQFLKHMLPEEYEKLVRYESIYVAEKRLKEGAWRLVLTGGRENGFRSDMEREIFNIVLYKLDILDFAKHRTEKQQYIDELLSDSADYDHIDKYLLYASTGDANPKPLHKLIALYGENKTMRVNSQAVLAELLHILTRPPIPITEEYLELLLDFREQIDLEQLSTITKQTLQFAKSNVLENCMHGIMDCFRIILVLFWGVDSYRSMYFRDMESVYDHLQWLNQKKRYGDLPETSSRPTILRNYFQGLREEARKEEYQSVGFAVDEIFDKIDLFLRIYIQWESIDEERIGGPKKNSGFARIHVIGENSWRENAMSQSERLIESLQDMRDYFADPRENYISRYSSVFLELLQEIVRRYQNHTEWYEERVLDVFNLSREITELVCQRDEQSTEYDRWLVMMIKVCMVDFERCILEP